MICILGITESVLLITCKSPSPLQCFIACFIRISFNMEMISRTVPATPPRIHSIVESGSQHETEILKAIGFVVGQLKTIRFREEGTLAHAIDADA